MSIKHNLTLKEGRASYYLTLKSRLAFLNNADALSEEQFLTALSNLLTDWFLYEAAFTTGRRSIIDVLVSRKILKLPTVEAITDGSK